MNRPLIMAAFGLPVLLCLSAGVRATTLDQTLSAAEHYSAGLSANAHQVNALKNMAESATQLPDPKLEFGIENVPVGGSNSRRFTREGMTMQKVGVMQQYVSSTKRDRQAETFEAEARKTEANKGVIRAQLQRDTAQAWFDLAISQRALDAVAASIKETRRQTGVQQAGVASGSAQASGVLDVQLALSELQDSQDNARRDVQVAQAKLMQLTGEDINTASGDFPRIERLPAELAVLQEGVKQHPEIIQAAREADVAKARSAQSAVAAIPDVGVEVYYGRRADGMDDLAGVMFTVDLPLFQGKRQDKNYAADMSRAYEANDQLTLLLREHQAQLNALVSQYATALTIYRRQNDEVLPLLAARLKLSEAQYQAGNSGLGEILEARRALLNGEIKKFADQKDLANAWAAIHYLIPQDVQ